MTPDELFARQEARQHRRRIWVAAAAAFLVVIAGAVLLGFALGRTRPKPATDSAGQQACQVANSWNKSRPGYIDQVIVETIHNQTVHSTHADLVDRGNDLYDAWTAASLQQIGGSITPAERDLRALGPLVSFRAACLEAGYGG